MTGDGLIVVKGAGDMATGVAVRLHRAGLRVLMTEIAEPTVVRRSVAFAEAVFAGETVVEGIFGRRCDDRVTQALEWCFHGAAITHDDDDELMRIERARGT